MKGCCPAGKPHGIRHPRPPRHFLFERVEIGSDRSNPIGVNSLEYSLSFKIGDVWCREKNSVHILPLSPYDPGGCIVDVSCMFMPSQMSPLTRRQFEGSSESSPAAQLCSPV